MISELQVTTLKHNRIPVRPAQLRLSIRSSRAILMCCNYFETCNTFDAAAYGEVSHMLSLVGP